MVNWAKKIILTLVLTVVLLFTGLILWARLSEHTGKKDYQENKAEIHRMMQDMVNKEEFENAILIGKKYTYYADQDFNDLYADAIAQQYEKQQSKRALLNEKNKAKLVEEFPLHRDNLLNALQNNNAENALSVALNNSEKYMPVADEDFKNAYRAASQRFNELQYKIQNIETYRKRESADKIDTYIMCRDHMEKRLKSPSTAKYPWNSNHTDISDDYMTFTVHAHVDSQNGFGAMIRTNYVCKMQRSPNDHKAWAIVDIYTE